MTSSGFDHWPYFGTEDAGRHGPIGEAGHRGGRLAAPMRRLLAGLDQPRAAQHALLALFAASALLNVLVGMLVCYRGSPQALDWDETEYWGMSGGILQGYWDFGERRTIAFPLIVAALRLLGGNLWFVQVGLSVIAGLAPPLLACVVRRLGGSPARGLLAGVLLAVWPAQLFLATSLYSETAALPCFLLFLVMLPPGVRGPGAERRPATGRRAGAALLAGLALGVCAQIRPMYLLFLPFALVIPFAEARMRRPAAGIAWRVALGFALVVLPWSIWLSNRHGEPIVLTANGGETLAGGLNPRLLAMPATHMHLANRDTWVGPGKWLPAQDTGFLSPAEARLPYPVMAQLLRQRSLAWIAANPGQVLRIELYKLSYMWGFYPWRGDEPVKLLAGNLPILGLLGIALVTALRCRVPWLALVRLWTVALFVTGVALISWGSWRFRQPADAALIAWCVLTVGTTPRRGVTAATR